MANKATVVRGDNEDYRQQKLAVGCTTYRIEEGLQGLRSRFRLIDSHGSGSGGNGSDAR